MRYRELESSSACGTTLSTPHFRFPGPHETPCRTNCATNDTH